MKKKSLIGPQDVQSVLTIELQHVLRKDVDLPTKYEVLDVHTGQIWLHYRYSNGLVCHFLQVCIRIHNTSWHAMAFCHSTKPYIPDQAPQRY